MSLLSTLGTWLKDVWPSALLCLLAFLSGYSHGEGAADARAEARIAALSAAQAEAAAHAEKSARERLAEAAALSERLQADLVNRERELDAQRREFNRRIRDVSEAARRDCAGLSADWVRLYNDALGLGRHPGNEAAAAGAPPDAAAPAGASGAGLREDALTTPEDVLAHARDYGHYCQSVSAAYESLIEYERNHP